MRRLLAGVLCGSLGWAATAAADELQWRPAPPRPAAAGTAPAPAVTLGRPVVSLGRPVVAAPEPNAPDPTLTRVSFQAPVTLSRPVVRMQGNDGKSLWATGADRAASGASTFATAGGPGSAVRPTGFAAEPPLGGAPAESPPPPLGGPPLGGPPLGGPPLGGPVTSAPLPGPTEFGEDGPCCGDGCFCDCCDADCCDRCGHRLYASAEYLLWAVRDRRFPPLVTTGPIGSDAALGQPGTVILFGGGSQAVHGNEFSGGRFTLGWWCDPCRTKAVELSYFFLGERTLHFGAGSGQFPVISRPIFSQNTGVETVERTARPGQGIGRIDIDSTSRLWGTDANLRCNICCGCYARWDFLAGLRYLDLTEGLNIRESIIVTGANPLGFPPGTQVLVADRFGTRNQFFGGQIGTALNLHYNRWSVDLLGKLALGNTHQVININGEQAVLPPGGSPLLFQGGLLALPTNSGRFTRDRFGVVPELGVNISYNVTDNLRLTVGYTWLFWNSVFRPGDQIDRVIDVNQVPNFTTPATRQPPVVGQSRPLVPFKDTPFWAQGVSFGLQYNY